MPRDPGVDAMMLAKIQEMRKAARALTQQPKAHAKKRKAKRKAGRKGRRGKRK